MKISTIVSIASLCFLMVCISGYFIFSEISMLLSSNAIESGKVSLFITLLMFSLVILTGIYRNKKWALYVFLSKIFFMTGLFITYRLRFDELALVDYWIIFCFVAVSSFVLYLLSKLQTNEIFSEEEFFKGN